MSTSIPAIVPRSAVRQVTALASLMLGLASIFAFRSVVGANAQTCFLVMVAAIASPHLLLELPRLAARVANGNAFSLRRLVVKCLALYVTFAAIVLVYAVARGFAAEFVLPLKSLWSWLGPVVLIATPFYVLLTDRVLVEPEDGVYTAGLALLGHEGLDGDRLKQYVLGWVVKGFFAPLMTGFALNDIGWLLSFNFTGLLSQGGPLYEFLYRFFFMVDVMFAASGYLLTFKLFDTHIRSTEPTALGWVVCLVCYAPFWQTIWDNFLSYDDDFYWGDWLHDSSWLWTVWAVIIIACVLVYAWATVSFGPRFSNLTNRGIITNGPYRFLKHPAYVSKNISWWMVSIPFISNGNISTAIINMCAMAAVSGIYTMRAITEERHLSRDPDYVAYSEWMKEHGLFARLKSLVGRRGRR